MGTWCKATPMTCFIRAERMHPSFGLNTFRSPFKGVGPTVSVGKNWTIKRGPARKVSTIVGFSLYPLLKEHVGEIYRQGVLLAAKAGETRGELELSMGTRVNHPGLR